MTDRGWEEWLPWQQGCHYCCCWCWVLLCWGSRVDPPASGGQDWTDRPAVCSGDASAAHGPAETLRESEWDYNLSLSYMNTHNTLTNTPELHQCLWSLMYIHPKRHMRHEMCDRFTSLSADTQLTEEEKYDNCYLRHTTTFTTGACFVSRDFLHL